MRAGRDQPVSDRGGTGDCGARREFTGEVLDEPVSGSLSYAGLTRVGGAIDANVILDGAEARAVLRADAQVAVGGSYSGIARLN